MRTNRSTPDFSFIRSPMERAQAQRSYEMGLVLADGLYAAGEALQRSIAGIARTFSRKPLARV